MTPFISVVVPLYDEELVVDKMYQRLTEVLKKNNLDYEIILINDGSKDGTMEAVRAICKKDRAVKLLSFSRNFGHQIAITAGMDKAAGQVVVIMDADLQDPPEVILQMIEKWKDNFQVVYGTRKKREGESFLKLLTAKLFYRIMQKMTNISIPVDTGDFRLMDRRVVEQLKAMRERGRFVRGMVSWVGFKQCKVEYIREKRFAGKTKYPFKKMLKFAMDGTVSFSQVPLRFSSFFGFLSSGLSFLFIIYGIIVKEFLPGRAVAGWTSVFVAILFLGGVQLICVGILGEYLGRIYEEIKGRPLYICEEEINFE
jgi:polyisoprenyl-phosphate glycosyltransferase